MRRSVAMLVVTGALVTAAAVPAGAVPPPPKPVGIYPDGLDPGCYIIPDVKVVIGQGVDWTNNDSQSRTVTQREGFWKFTVAAGADHQRTMHSAGTFFEKCDQGTPDHSVGVPVKAPGKTSSASFTVTWADSSSPSGVTYSVRYRVGSSGTFTGWKSGTSLRSATFDGAHGKTYQFEGRSIRSGGRTAWSPPKTVQVS